MWGHWSPKKAIDAAEQHNRWSTGRHYLYPTTDISAKDLPKGMGKAAINLATQAVLPSIAFAFNEPVERLYFKDLFLAKYETSGQPGLGKHTDGSTYSFNMLLSDPTLDFDGGGTWIKSVRLVWPEMWDVLMHQGNILHEECPVSRGVRYVLVGFVQSDASYSCISPNRKSELLVKTVGNFPLRLVIKVDKGDETSCTMIANIVENGVASRAGLRKGDCIRGIMLPNYSFH
jgi:hypothetical protein